MKISPLLSVLIIVCVLVSISTPLRADDDAVMDVDDSKAATVGTWHNSTFLPCAVGGAYKYTWGSSGGQRVTFETERTADITGQYAVYARWSSHSNRNNQARYKIYDGTTLRATRFVDQRSDGCNWRYLATVKLTSGHKGKVVLDPYNASSNEATIADAVRFVRITKDGYDIADNSIYDWDIADEPGIDYASKSSKSVSTISTNCNSLTNLATTAITIPTPGYVWVYADGIYVPSQSNKWLRIGIDNASGGNSFDSLAPFLESPNNSVYARERRFAVNKVYYFGSSGKKYFYLKACRENGADGTIMWDDFVTMFFPTRYH